MVKAFIQNFYYGNGRNTEIKTFPSVEGFINWVMTDGKNFGVYTMKDGKKISSSSDYGNDIENWQTNDGMEIVVRYSHRGIIGQLSSKSVKALYEDGKCIASRKTDCFPQYNFKDFVSNTFVKEVTEVVFERNNKQKIQYAE